ncbi:MAG TPA: NADP-dependent oxidoreductase [Streptosporangiaceae bacterium]|nr:NADP-dependent oxidoreductase [Streptosporangiaceae bacterium]
MTVPSHADVIVLARRPGPAVLPGDLAVERRRVRPPGPGEVVVRNVVTSVDPYQLSMLRGATDVATVCVGDPVPASSVGIVVQSQDPHVPDGTQVATYTGWQAYATTRIGPTEVADPRLGGPVEWLSVLGPAGVAAYVGVHDVGHLQPGGTMLVSAASGGVGGVAVQLGKAAGARVIAIAGGRARTGHAVWVLGADVAVDYLGPAFAQQLRQAAGPGADVFFDNVGGRQLTLALSVLKHYGRVVLCGSVSSYARPDDPAGAADLTAAVCRRITLQGYIASDYYPGRLKPVREELGALLHANRIRAVVSEFHGLDSAPRALAAVFDRGSAQPGKRVVRITDG